jgi:DNA-binding GntR family transcriptional regulator
MTERTSKFDLIGLNHRPLEAVVCDEIRSRIVAGALPPGSRLVESALAEEFAVSMAPVREAIRRLEHEGFVSISPRRGAAVAQMSAEDVLDCYEIREALEVVAHRLAARRRKDEHLDDMRRLLGEGDQLVRGEKWAELANVNTAFHASVSSASGNRELAELLAQYARRITWIFSQSAITAGRHAWSEHSSIADAIERQDESEAEALIRQHLSQSRQRYLKSMGRDV